MFAFTLNIFQFSKYFCPVFTNCSPPQDGLGRRLPAVPPALLASDQAGLGSLELKQMGRETIAGLIAGILQKYTRREVR